MSQGSCVAAREGVPPPASSPATASVVAAARASSALLVCLRRGLTVIVDIALPFGNPPVAGLPGIARACGHARARVLVSDHILFCFLHELLASLNFCECERLHDR